MIDGISSIQVTDGRDCVCSEGCHQAMTSDSECQEACNVAEWAVFA